MKDQNKTKAQLIAELLEIRGRVTELEQPETDRKLAEKKIKHLNNVLHAIRNVNQLITKEKDRDRLITHSCKLLVETRGYASAWLVLLDENQKTVASAQAGLGAEFTALLKQMETNVFNECSGQALKQSGVVVIEDPKSFCGDCPLVGLEPALRALTIRLEHEGRIFGLFSVEIPGWLFLDEEEQELFEEVANDIAFALHAIELEEERKRAEAELREEHERAQTYLDLASVMFVAIDAAGTVTLINRKACEVLEYEEEEIIERNWFDTCLPQYLRETVKEVSKQLLRGEIEPAEYYENPVLTKSGTERLIAWHNTVLRDDEGAIIGHLSSGEDITVRKRAEEALRESEERYRGVVEDTPVLICCFLPDGEITFVNKTYCEYFARTPEELVGSTFLSLIPESDRETLMANITALTIDSPTQSHEHEVIAPGGDLRWQRWTNRALFNAQGKAVAYQSIGEDITERKRAEEAQQLEHTRMMSILDTIPDGVYIVSQQCDIEYINPVIEREFGPIDGRKCYEYLNDLTQVCPWCKNVKVFAGESVQWEWYSFKNNRYYDLFDIPFKNVDGSISKFEFFHDITERRQALEALRESEERFRFLAENMADVVWTLDLDFKTTYVSPSIKKVLGFTPEERILHTVEEMVTPASLQRLMAMFLEESQRDGEQDVDPERYITIEVEYYHAEGYTVWMENSIKALRDKSGAIIGMYGSSRDITERKLAAEALRESEDKHRTTIENLPLGILTLDQDGVVTSANPAFTKIFDLPSDEVVGKTIINSLSFIHDNILIQYFSALVEKSTRFDFESQAVTTPTGKLIYLRVRGLPIQDFQENTKSFLVVIGDITDRRQAEEAMHENRTKLLQAQYIAKMGDFSWNIQTGEASWSDGMYKLLKYDRDEIINYEKVNNDIHHPEDLERVTRWLMDSIASGQEDLVPNEYRLVCKDGEIIYVQTNGRIEYEDGKAKKLFGTCLNITERKKAENDLKESEEKLRNIFDNSTNLFYSHTPEHILTYLSPQVKDILGYTPEEAMVKWTELASDNPINEEGFQKTVAAIESGRIQSPYELELVHKNGRKVMLEIREAPVVENGKTVAIVGAATDITDRKRAEEEKAKLETQLRRSHKLEAIGVLAGGIAHDFNNVLTPIMGYTDMALSSLSSSDPLCEDLEHVLKAANRAKDLVEQILLFSKQVEKERKPLSLHLIVNEAVKLLRPSIPSTVEIRQRIDSSCDKILADPSQMHQVIVNLCNNAWQAMEEKGGILTIELNQVEADATTVKLLPNLNEAEYVRLTVIDTGTGMDKTTLGRIFEPYFTTKAVDKGTGMGLSVVYGIVRSHYGDILVYSEPGKGSTFHVYLPIVKADVETDKKEKKAIVGGQESILIVDDEELVADVVKMMLERLGYKVDVYNNGLKALKVIRQQPDKYDLLISDLTMPNITGLDFSKQLQKIRSGFPVIIMTGYGDILTNATQKQYGIKQVIGKPISIRELASAIRRVMDK